MPIARSRGTAPCARGALRIELMVLERLLVEMMRKRLVIRASSCKASSATSADSLCIRRKQTVQSMDWSGSPSAGQRGIFNAESF